jgi:hypothetical protein
MDECCADRFLVVHRHRHLTLPTSRRIFLQRRGPLLLLRIRYLFEFCLTTLLLLFLPPFLPSPMPSTRNDTGTSLEDDSLYTHKWVVESRSPTNTNAAAGESLRDKVCNLLSAVLIVIVGKVPHSSYQTDITSWRPRLLHPRISLLTKCFRQ